MKCETCDRYDRLRSLCMLNSHKPYPVSKDGLCGQYKKEKEKSNGKN